MDNARSKIGISFGLSMLSYRETVAASVEISDFAPSVWIPDSQYLYRDCFVLLTGVAEATRGVTIGTLVTNTVTRHPSVVAAAAGTVEEMAPGRFILGIGVGDRAVRRSALKSATVRRFERDVIAIKRFRDGGVGEEGLAPPDWPVPHFPVHVVATGKRTIELASQVGDGLVINVGADPTMLGSHVDRAREAGGPQFPVRSFNFFSVSSDRNEALARLRPAVAWFAMNRPYIVDELNLPRDEHILSRLAELRSEGFDVAYSRDWSSAMKMATFVPDSWVEALGIAGTPRDVTRRVDELTSVGIEEIVVRPPAPALWQETVDDVRQVVKLTG